jgi:hypothetical protein
MQILLLIEGHPQMMSRQKKIQTSPLLKSCFFP